MIRTNPAQAPVVTVERCRTLRGVLEPNEWDILVDGEWVGTMGRRTGIYNTTYDVRLDGGAAVYLPAGTTCWGAKAIAAELATPTSPTGARSDP